MNWKKGDIAIYVRPGSPYYGTEVEVLSGLEYCTPWNIRTGVVDCFMGYHITDLYPEHPGRLIARPEWLRPKDEGAGDWFRENIRIKVDELLKV